MIDYNGNFNSDYDNDIEFVDLDLPCNKLSVRLLANDSITRTKKKHQLKTRDEVDEPSKVKAIQEKRKPVQRVGKKSSKASVPISGLVSKISRYSSPSYEYKNCYTGTTSLSDLHKVPKKNKTFDDSPSKAS